MAPFFAYQTAPEMIGTILLYLALVNTMAFVAFRHDKANAITGEQRIPENTLLILALIGGWVGAKVAQRRYRHKTRKQPFALMLNMTIIVWMVGICIPAAASSMQYLPRMAVASLFHLESGKKPERTTPRFFQSVSH
ncbi:MAG: DUF1294 domain-containing protein [Roseobacter sp.]|nr:DUF1294 domain-containing protein [Roseobacter sp.]